MVRIDVGTGVDTSASYAPEEEVNKVLERLDEANIIQNLRYNFFFGREGIDIDLLRKSCLSKECVREKVEYHKQRNIITYNKVLAQANNFVIGKAEAISTANHLFYDALFHDLISVIEAFGNSYELGLYNDVYQEYLDKYPNYAEQFQEDPLGWTVSRTVKPFVDVGVAITGAVAKGTAEAIFGSDWKTKLILYGSIILAIVIVGFLGYYFLKSYVSEKARKKARS